MTLMVLLFSSLSQASTIENDELLLKALIERGVICPGLTYEDNHEALRIYLNAKQMKGRQFDSKKRPCGAGLGLPGRDAHPLEPGDAFRARAIRPEHDAALAADEMNQDGVLTLGDAGRVREVP